MAAWPFAARAKPKIPCVGYMGNSTAALEANLVGAFRDGLRELGYDEGRNIVIEYRWAEANYAQFPDALSRKRTHRGEGGRDRHCR